ncbi:MAG: DNA recombination protein RmuC [Alphaproteobacteria bacterium]|nr:DNA recombination protein RmuC [Alphaproteobacteria bacterium]
MNGVDVTLVLAVLLALVIVLGAVVLGAVLLTRRRTDRDSLAAQAGEIARERQRAEAAQQDAARDLAAKAAAETRLAEAQRLMALIEAERDAAITRRDAALVAEREAARALAVMQQRLTDGEARIADFERLKEETLKQMQAAALETTQLLSSKLLEDHKRENAEAKQQGEALVKQTTEQLFQRFEQVSEAVAQLKGQVGANGQQLDTVWRALTSPGGSGYYAEIGLANTLASFGLIADRDYVLQHTTEDAATGRRLRPDAVVFLPGDSALVIDSKASKALIEIAEAEGTEQEEAAYQSLARTMNQHLKALAEKDYRSAIAATWREAGRGGTIARILSVMYLPNEGALEKLHRADPDFTAKAAKCEIVPVGPAGLAGLIGFASVEISLIRQIENQQEIVRGTEKLLESLTVALGNAAAVGRNVRAAATAYESFARSVNGRLLGRGRKLTELGLRPGKALPDNLPIFHLQALDSVIEGEAEALSEPSDRVAPETAILLARAGE